MCLPYFHMASPLLLVDHGAAATAMQKKAYRAAAAYAAFAATATTAAAAASAVLLLLSHTGTSSPCSQKNMLCFAMPVDRIFW